MNFISINQAPCLQCNGYLKIKHDKWFCPNCVKVWTNETLRKDLDFVMSELKPHRKIKIKK